MPRKERKRKKECVGVCMYACESKINLNIIHESTLPQFYIIDCCYTYVLTYIYNIYLYINQDLASRDTCRSRGSPGYGQ